MKKILFAATAMSVLSLSGCLDMGIPEGAELLAIREYRAGCPAGYGNLVASLHECPKDEECITLDDGQICVRYHIDTQGGNGINCDAGWITVSDSEAKNCSMLTEEADIENVAELDSPSGDYYCAPGRVANRYCRYVPPETSDSRVNVMTGQRCTAEQSSPGNDTLRIHIIDVANGDAIWIQTPTGQNVLIDAGDSGAFGVTAGGPIVNDYLEFHGFPKGSAFDAVFLSHPHADHFGGFPVIFAANAYNLKNYIDPMELNTTEVDTSSYLNWIRRVQTMVDSAHIYMPAGEKFSTNEKMPVDFFGPDVTAEYLFSRKKLAAANGNLTNPNTASIIFRLTYAGVSMLFTGDATDVDETAVVASVKEKLPANFLKVCHHGSETSSTPGFLHAIYDTIPTDKRGAFISSGRKNFSGTYIPSYVTLNRLVDEKFVTINQLYSTSAGDDGKTESEAYRDDNILIVVKSDGSYYSCYSGTN